MPTRVGSYEPEAERAIDALSEGHRLLISIVPMINPDYGAYVSNHIAITADGDIAFLDECGFKRATRPLVGLFNRDPAAAGASASQEEVLLRIIRDPTGDFARRVLHLEPAD